MILVDANLLIYAHVNAFAQRQAARDWLDEQLNEVSRVGLPSASLLAFLRVAKIHAYSSIRSQSPMPGRR